MSGKGTESKPGSHTMRNVGIAFIVLLVLAGIITAIYYLTKPKPVSPVSSSPATPIIPFPSPAPAPAPAPAPVVPPSPAPAPLPAQINSVTGLPMVQSPWACAPQIQTNYNGNNLPVQVNAQGDIQCMSSDGKNCLWTKDCDSQTKNPPQTINPYVCPDGNYFPGHWCGDAVTYFKQK